MEHGGRFDPDKVVEVAAVRTERTIVYYVRDPGPGFRPEAMEHAASDDPSADPLAHIEKRLEQGLRPGGFGILMAKNVVDELIYSEHGNEVVLDQAPEAVSASPPPVRELLDLSGRVTLVTGAGSGFGRDDRPALRGGGRARGRALPRQPGGGAAGGRGHSEAAGGEARAVRRPISPRARSRAGGGRGGARPSAGSTCSSTTRAPIRSPGLLEVTAAQWDDVLAANLKSAVALPAGGGAAHGRHGRAGRSST